MYRNYLKVALRNLRKRKVFSLINILGLATGMAVCLLIVLFIQDEVSFDKFHEKGDRVYRVALERIYPGRKSSYAIIPTSIGDAMKHEFPEIEQETHFFDLIGTGSFVLKYNDKVFEEHKVFLADSNFFKVFSAVTIAGDPATSLQKTHSVVITQTTAERIFGSAKEAVGRQFTTVVNDGNPNYVVGAVVKEWPKNSHFRFDMLVSAPSFKFASIPNYIGFSAYTYLLLKKGTSPTAVEAKFPFIIQKYVSGEIGKAFNQSYEAFTKAGNGYHYFLQPISQIHLKSDIEAEMGVNGSSSTVYLFTIVAIFILTLACINFINLSTSLSVERAKEVGIRKTFGSEKHAIINQFLTESVLISIISLVLAFGLVFLSLPLFNALADKSLSITYFFTIVRLLAIVAAAFIIGIIAGIYPAFILSSFNPITVLKGRFKSNKYGLLLRNGLVVFQFSVSIILIIATIIVNQQIGFMLGDKLGFRKDHVIIIKDAFSLKTQTQTFKDEVAKIPGVDVVSGTSALPGQVAFFGASYDLPGGKQPMTGRGIGVDENYAKLLGLQLKEGRFFSTAYATDSSAIVLNEKAATELGLKNPIGAIVNSPDNKLPDGSERQFTVIGVVKDFHYQSLHQAINPLVFNQGKRFNNVFPFIGVRVNSNNLRSSLSGIEAAWNSFVKDRPFHYDFLDQTVAAQYHAEQTTQKVFEIFSILAIFIACIGLMGLAAYATQQRIREIGIRKVLGASVSGIVTMLSKDFLVLIVLSGLIAFPIAWWGMHSWLQGFVYRVSVSVWVFVSAGLMAVAIAMLTISFQAIKAAIMNPVKSLRSE